MGRTHRHGIASTAAIFGHPIHPMLIPFPAASLMALPLTDVVHLATGEPFWANVSWWLLAAGIVTGLVAAVPGIVDYYSNGNIRRLASAKLHGLGNVAAIALSGVNLYLRWNEPANVSGLPVVLSFAVLGILGVTAWLGGELSYRHRIGIADPDRHYGAETANALHRAEERVTDLKH